jgi:hypothetical protein
MLFSAIWVASRVSSRVLSRALVMRRPGSSSTTRGPAPGPARFCALSTCAAAPVLATASCMLPAASGVPLGPLLAPLLLLLLLLLLLPPPPPLLAPAGAALLVSMEVMLLSAFWKGAGAGAAGGAAGSPWDSRLRWRGKNCSGPG